MPDGRNRTLVLYSDILGMGSMFLGTLVFIGGWPRMSSASFTYLVQIASPAVWGVLLIVAGLSAVLGQALHLKWLLRGGHSMAGTICLFWTGAFTAGAARNSTSPWTGIAAYLIIGVLHCAAAGLTPAWGPRARR